ncbi:hypothetical protein R6Q59_011197 [Mikania micrantha]
MSESKKIIIKVDVHDNEEKRKALKAVSSHPGIESISMDMKDKKLTIVGVIDPVCAVRKLKKWHPEILTVGPAKDEAKDQGNKDSIEVNHYYFPYMTPPCCVHIEENPNSCVIF